MLTSLHCLKFELICLFFLLLLDRLLLHTWMFILISFKVMFDLEKGSRLLSFSCHNRIALAPPSLLPLFSVVHDFDSCRSLLPLLSRAGSLFRRSPRRSPDWLPRYHAAFWAAVAAGSNCAGLLFSSCPSFASRARCCGATSPGPVRGGYGAGRRWGRVSTSRNPHKSPR